MGDCVGETYECDDALEMGEGDAGDFDNFCRCCWCCCTCSSCWAGLASSRVGVLLRIIWVVAVVGVVTLMDGKWRCILWGLLLLDDNYDDDDMV